LPPGLIAAAATAVLCAVVAVATAGVPGLLGALAGCAAATASFVVSSVSVAWADSVNPKLVLVVGMTVYAAKMLALGASLYALRSSDWAGLPAMGWALAATVVVWVAVQAVWVYRSRIPYVDLTPSRTGAGS
jgi:ATP synthase protein I